MALAPAVLAEKRTRKVLRRRSFKRGRRTAAKSHDVGSYRRRMRLDAEELARRNEAYEAERARSRAAVQEASRSKRGGFLDGVKSRLFQMLPRRTP